MNASDFIFTGSRFVHMVGDFVAVCSKASVVKRAVTVDGVEYTAKVNTPVLTDAYIDFVDLRQDRGGEWYEDDDSPVEGGLAITHAQKVADELNKAIEYIKGVLE